MKINESLNIVVNVGDAFGYHSPISREVFEVNYRMIAATKSALAGKGIQYQMVSGPRIASLTLLDECRNDSQERGDFGIDGKPSDLNARALLAEIKRLTTILVPSANGYDMIPVDAAISRGAIDAEDWAEAESELVFFTCHYALAAKMERKNQAQAIASLLNGVSTSLMVTEYANSLQVSTTATDSTAAASSVPH